MNAGWERDRFTTARVAVLGTVTPDGAPHQVPVTFALLGDTLWTATDAKPKRGGSTREGELRRHVNVAAHPEVSLLVSAWDEDWSRLWWVRADGLARVTERPATVARAVEALRRKYGQYADVEVGGPVIEVTVTAWRGWRAAG
jgi:PPOX class probable F420-dependent enzyme